MTPSRRFSRSAFAITQRPTSRAACRPRVSLRSIGAARRGFLTFLFEAAFDPLLCLGDVLLPRRRVDEGIGLASFTRLEHGEALEERAVGIIGAGIPAMVGQVHFD